MTMTDAQLQMLADDFIAKYKDEIVKDRDWWYGIDEYSFNIHSTEDDVDGEDYDWYSINVYKVDPVTGMDNYEWMIDLPRVFIKGENTMKNGYTPKEYAYSMAIDHLQQLWKHTDYWADDEHLSEANIKQVKEQIAKLRIKLADTAKLDTTSLM